MAYTYMYVYKTFDVTMIMGCLWVGAVGKVCFVWQNTVLASLVSIQIPVKLGLGFGFRV